MFTQSDGHTRKWWPGEFRPVHRVTFGSELRLELVCMNTGTTPFRFEEALHTYNRIANIQDARCGRELRTAVPVLHQLHRARRGQKENGGDDGTERVVTLGSIKRRLRHAERGEYGGEETTLLCPRCVPTQK